MTYAAILCREIHEAGWTYEVSLTLTIFIGPIYIAEATKGDGHRYIAQADTELGALMALKKMLDRAADVASGQLPT